MIKPRLSICIPTYKREVCIRRLWETSLSPLLQLFGDEIEVIVRDNSADVPLYDSSSVKTLLSNCNYKLNDTNLGYHGNILELFNSAKGDYIWFWPDDDLYNLDSCSSIVSAILDGSISADLILPPFGFEGADFTSTDRLIVEIDDSPSSYKNKILIYSVDFESILKHGSYPDLALTSSFILNRASTSFDNRILEENSENAWLHEVVVLAHVNRRSTVQVLKTKPYVYYNTGNGELSDMSIDYFHDNNIARSLLRSRVFDLPALYSEEGCWLETLLWLIRAKDGSVNWSNNQESIKRLVRGALAISLSKKYPKLLFYSLSYLVLPHFVIKKIRAIRGRL